MPDEPADLYGRWGHSFEEDHDDVSVYRPTDFAFPRARGRGGLEFRPDGSYVRWAVGRGDAGEGHVGRWRLESPERIRIAEDDGAEEVVQIMSIAADRLEVRHQVER